MKVLHENCVYIVRLLTCTVLSVLSSTAGMKFDNSYGLPMNSTISAVSIVDVQCLLKGFLMRVYAIDT